MHWTYLDISGFIETDGLCVVGAACCQDPHVPQYLLRHTKDDQKDVAVYFNRNAEFKFSSMIKDKFRVRALLEETLTEISNEKNLTLCAGVISNNEELERGAAAILASIVPLAGEVRIMVDKGSLDCFDCFFRIRGKFADPKKSVVFLGNKKTSLDTIVERLKVKSPVIQRIEIHHASSHEYCGIQLADLVAGAVFQKESRKNKAWFDCLKGKAKLMYF